MKDCYYSRLVEFAHFDGIMEIPYISRPNEFIIPEGLVPFSKRHYCSNSNYFICFYENDDEFIDFLISPEKYLDDLKKFAGVILPDPSLDYDMPLIVQLYHVYLSRAIGIWLQQNDIYAVVNVRWGDERTYTTNFIPEMVPFLGIEQDSIIAIGTYGCSQGAEELEHLRNGLNVLIEQCHPRYVLVYGSFPKKIFQKYASQTTFVHYPDWTTHQH